MAASSTTSSQLPGPPSLPLLGIYANAVPFFRDPIAYMRGLHARYGDIAAMGEGRSRYVFVFAPEYNRQILSDPALFYTADAGSQPLRIREGTALARMFTGLVQTNGEWHTRQRRLMMPAFHRRRIEAYRDDMVALTERQIAGWPAWTTPGWPFRIPKAACRCCRSLKTVASANRRCVATSGRWWRRLE